MKPKFKAGDLVRFVGKEFEIPSPEGLSVKLDADRFVGKVTGSVDAGSLGIDYFLDVYVYGVTWKVKVKEDQIISLRDYVCDMVDGIIKEFSSGDTADTLRGLVDGLRKGSEIRSKENDSIKKDPIDFFRFGKKFGSKLLDFDNALVSRFVMDPDRYSLRIDSGVDYSKMPEPKSVTDTHDMKMSKQRCIKLLESYRAEREKVRSGRRFERCLRDSVVDEALERAIELLKGGES